MAAEPQQENLDGGGDRLDDAHLQALVLAVADKDPDALHQLYTLTATRLQHALTAVGDTASIENALVATYVRVWRSAAAQRTTGPTVITWLTSLALTEIPARRRAAPPVSRRSRARSSGAPQPE